MISGYPRELNLDKDTEARLISYLDYELINHYHEREPYLEKLHKWQVEYWAEPSQERLTFPFDGAANIVIPLTAIAVEAIHARNMMQFYSLPRLVSAKSVSEQWDDSVHGVEGAMEYQLRHNIKFLEKTESSILECEKFGTGIGKTSYEKLVRTAVRTLPNGKEEDFQVVIKEGAVVDSVSFARFLMPYYGRNPQDAPWCGEEHNETPYKIKLLEDSGYLRPGTFEKLRNWVSRSPVGTFGLERKFERQQEELEKREVTWPQYIDWQEIQMAFDVDSAATEFEGKNGYQANLSTRGVPKEIIVHYHRASQTLMSVRYNWYNDLHREYRTCRYFPTEHRWTGIGICKQNEQFQMEITTQHRQRLDNATLANMRMIKISKMSGYGPNEPVFPGKMWFVDSMDHIDTMQMGEIYPSAYNNEQATLIYSQQRSGVNEQNLGMPQVGTPGTATGDMARIQEGKMKFDYTYHNIRTYLGELVTDSACIIQQFGPKNLTYFDVADDGSEARKFFNMPESLIRENLLIEIGISSQQQNKILDRQNWAQISQILTGYFTGLIQLAEAAQQPQLVQQIAMKGMVGATEAIKQILESYDVRNIDRIIMRDLINTLKGADNAQAKPAAANGLLPPSNGNGNGGDTTSDSLSRVAQLNEAVSRLREGGAGGTNGVSQPGTGF